MITHYGSSPLPSGTLPSLTELRLSDIGRYILHYLTLPTSYSLGDDVVLELLQAVGAKLTDFNLSGMQ